MPGKRSTSRPDEELERCLEAAFAEHRKFRALMSELDRPMPRRDQRKGPPPAAGANERFVARPG
jgi:hypothetical protein